MLIVRAFVEATEAWKTEEWESVKSVKQCVQEWMIQFKSISDQQVKVLAMMDKYEVICELLKLLCMCLLVIDGLGSQELINVIPKNRNDRKG